jgi:hypothetical protein
MSNDIKRLSAVEQMLEQEGEQGPTLCLSAHEARIAPLENEIRQRLRQSLTVLPADNDRVNDMVKACSKNTPGNRMCAHNGENIDPLVYQNEIVELWESGVIDEATYLDLCRKNNKAGWQIYSFDTTVRDIAQNSPQDLQSKRERLEIRQRRIWDEHVNPIREKLLSSVRNKLSKKKAA